MKKRSTRGRKFPSEPLTSSEVRQILAQFRGNLGIRNAALVTLLWQSGIRIASALALRPTDVGGDSLRVLRGKGGHAATLGLTLEARRAIDDWLERREALAIDSELLFTTLKGEKIAPNAARELLKRAARRAGIKKRVHPHGLRASFAVQLVASGLPLNVVQEALTHRHLTTTALYLRGLRPSAVEAVRSVQF